MDSFAVTFSALAIVLAITGLGYRIKEAAEEISDAIRRGRNHD
jgi:hypothetical protein